MTKIMLVEDDEIMRRLLKTVLELEGFEVSTAGQTQDQDIVIESIRAEKPRVVVMDVYLGELNGFDLLSRIRQDNELHELGVIMCSGLDFYSRCKEAGADGFIMKPYSPNELTQMVHEIIAIDN